MDEPKPPSLVSVRTFRVAMGCACVLAAAAFLALQVPRTLRHLNASFDSFGYIHTPLDRLITTGDILGISRELQLEALELIPSGSTYVLLLPGTPATAQQTYGIGLITYETTPAFLHYLLLPSIFVEASDSPEYVICWGCDTTPWDHRTHWLWEDPSGAAIGKVES